MKRKAENRKCRRICMPRTSEPALGQRNNDE